MTDITAALEAARELVRIDEAGLAYVLPGSLQLARALLALAASHEAMRAVVEAAERTAPRIEPPGDWCCAECRPDSDMLHVNPGWLCHVHALRAALDGYRGAK